jgi:hypothetical protein
MTLVVTWFAIAVLINKIWLHSLLDNVQAQFSNQTAAANTLLSIVTTLALAKLETKTWSTQLQM